MNAEMFSYSRAQGVFAGVSLSGSTLGPDDGANQNIYGKKLSATQIINGQDIKAPAAALKLLEILKQKSPNGVAK